MVSDTVLIALIAGVPAALTAAAGLIVSLRNGRKTDAVHIQATTAADKAVIAADKADVAVIAANDLAAGQKEIHGLVNGNLSTVKAECESLRKENDILRALIAKFISAEIQGKPTTS